MSINKSMSNNKKLLSLVKLVKLFVSCIQKCCPSKNFRGSAPNPAGGLTAPQTPTAPAKHLHSPLATTLFRYYSIWVDEVTSHNVEHLAVCARFVDGVKDIREEFLTFLPMEWIPGKSIADALIGFLDKHGIPLTDMLGQGYDGASNISSSRAGVQCRILQVAPLASYIHYSGHCLNLVITKSCAVPDIRYVLDRLKYCCKFFLNSPKRSGLLEQVVTANVPDAEKRKPLLDLCKTRWAERHVAYQRFYQGLPFIVEAQEVMGYKRHIEKYGETYLDWEPKVRSEAQQIVTSITSFSFIVTFMAVYQYLSHLSGITVKLQKTSLDIIKAHELVNESTLSTRRSIEMWTLGFQRFFSRASVCKAVARGAAGAARAAPLFSFFFFFCRFSQAKKKNNN